MSIKNIVQLGNQEARKKSVKVTDFNDPRVKRVIKNLLDTMMPAGLVGMAAPQVGVNLRILVTHMRLVSSRPGSKPDKPRVFINPRITYRSKETQTDYEGCGSVASAQIFGPVARPKTIIIKAWNEKGEPFELKAVGLLARIIQHENDHLDGIFFTDRVKDNRKLMSLSEYIKARKEKRI